MCVCVRISIGYEIFCTLGANKFHVTLSLLDPNVAAPAFDEVAAPQIQRQSSKELAGSCQPSLGGMIYTKIFRRIDHHG